jgi:hypothetical protein
MKTYVTLIAAIALCPLAGSADPLPKPVENMERLVGNWKGGGTVAMGKDKAKLDTTLECKPTSSKFGVLCTTHMTGIPGMAAYDETDLFGYEPNSDTYHWFAVTNAGETHDHVAKAPSGDRLEFTYNGTQEGKPFRETIVLELAKDGKSLTGHVDELVGGQLVGSMDMKLRK